MVYLTFFSTVVLLIILVFSLVDERKKRMQRRMKVFLDSKNLEIEEKQPVSDKTDPLIKRLLFPFFRLLKRIFKRNISRQKEDKIEIKLLQAGSPFGMAPIDFRIFQVFIFLILPTLFGIIAKLLNADTTSIVFIILINIVLALILPHYYINIKMKQRNRIALKELPDVVDLLTVSLEAGLGFDSALTKLISKKNGVLSEEFHRCLEEIRLGKTRRDALKGVRERLLVDELSALINSILQAEKLGISMVHILRIQSHEIRQQRKQRAEEAAMKAPIKMLFPLVIFIFPSLFIVLLGPALIQFLTTF